MNKKNTLLLISTLIIIFFISELTLRINEEDTQQKTYIRHAEYNPFLIFGPKINKTIMYNNAIVGVFNAEGLRLDGELPREKESGEYRVFALGGSTTENIANHKNIHYCGEATKILKEEKIKCINAGHAAYSTAQSIIRLEFDLLKYNPDAITIMHNINDLSINFFKEDMRTNYGNAYFNIYFTQKKEEGFFNNIKQIAKLSRTIVFINEKMDIIKHKYFGKEYVTKEGKHIKSTMKMSDKQIKLHAKEQFKRNLLTLIGVAKIHNIKPILMTQPATFSEEKIIVLWGDQPYNNEVIYPPLSKWRDIFEEYNNIIREVAKEENVSLIDMEKLLKKEESYFLDMVHYSEEGIREFAKIYAKELKEIKENG